MTTASYPRETSSLIIVDPYNDFLSVGGKIWPRIQSVAEDVELVGNLKTILGEFRRRGMLVAFAPHRRWEPDDYSTWKFPNPTQVAVMSRHTFARGEWGGDWHPDFVPESVDLVAKEHWGQSGFANTDLDQQLRQRGITHVIVVGLLANTCIESTARYAMELGYHVTLVRDATAAYSFEMMSAAHDLNGPTFAHTILTTAELTRALPDSLGKI